MQSLSQPGASTSSRSETSSFAGFLSALATPAPAPQNTGWNQDSLADDVITLSYESALKAHSRYKPAPDPLLESNPVAPAEAAPSSHEHPSQAAARSLNQVPTLAGDLKTASITIRMSHSECGQLKQRAAEAGMTVSAYMRSCTFEAEALRGQVKEAVEQMRAATTAETKKQASSKETHDRFTWLHRFVGPRGEHARSPAPAGL